MSYAAFGLYILAWCQKPLKYFDGRGVDNKIQDYQSQGLDQLILAILMKTKGLLRQTK